MPDNSLLKTLNFTLQQIFPTDEAAFKLVYLVMRNIFKKWIMPIKEWKPALNRFTIEFEGGLST
jgi:putative transposase